MKTKKNSSNFRLFAVSPPGLEGITAKELSRLGLSGKIRPGGVEFRGPLAVLYQTNLWLRTANRILLRIAEFRVLHLNELRLRIARYPWEIYIPDGSSIKIRATCSRSRLYHSGAVAERVLRGIEDRLGRKLSEEGPEVLIVVRLFKDQCLVSVDTSGKDLFRRGYKLGKGPAPLRENLAAAMLLASGWDGRSPLVDPFCGTGTIAIEAAMIAADIAPGLKRSFAFEAWRNFDKDLWSELRAKAIAARKEISKPLIWASDHSLEAIKASQTNVKVAEVENLIVLEQRAVKELFPPTGYPGWIVTNPPYGRRLRPRTPVWEVYKTLGYVFQRRFPNWKLVLVSPYRNVSKALNLPLKKLTSFDHGGLKVNLWGSST